AEPPQLRPRSLKNVKILLPVPLSDYHRRPVHYKPPRHLHRRSSFSNSLSGHAVPRPTNLHDRPSRIPPNPQNPLSGGHLRGHALLGWSELHHLSLAGC